MLRTEAIEAIKALESEGVIAFMRGDQRVPAPEAMILACDLAQRCRGIGD